MVLLTIYELECVNCKSIYKACLPTFWVEYKGKTCGINLCDVCRTPGGIINLDNILKILKNRKHKKVKQNAKRRNNI